MHRVQLSLINLTSFNDKRDDERRRPGRIACERLRCGSGRVVDLSRTGAKLRIRSLFAPRVGEQRSLTFQTSMGPSAPFPCVIMWVKKAGVGTFEVGAQFGELDPLRARQLNEIAQVHGKRTVIREVA